MVILLVIALVAILIALYWATNKPKYIKPPCDLSKQSVLIKGNDRARRCALLKGDDTISYYYSDVRTLYEAFQRGLHASDNGPCLGYRKQNQPYQWLSYKQVTDRAKYLGSGLLHRGCKPTPDQYIGVFSQNRPEWIISEQACYTYSMSVVPLYDTLGLEAIVYIINKAEISTAICDKPSKANLLLDNCEKGLTPPLHTIILMDPFDDALKERGIKCKVDVLSLKEVEPPKPEDVCVVCFTSGTTGAISNARIILILILIMIIIVLLQAAVYSCGARVGFFQGNIQLLMDDMKHLQPTIFPVVPRLLNRIYDKVQNGAKSPLKKGLLDFAIARKKAEVLDGIVRNDSIWDKLVFNKVQASMGGRVRLLITAAAPISPSVLTFLRAVLGCQIFEAYGQTECTGGCTISLPGDTTADHVGAPIPCNIVKLVDVAEMNYFASNEEGEICIKGTNVFKGYLKDPERTAEALDADGWLHTGDIGRWLPNGTLKIIDRKKNIFKLAQGEYIAPEKVENVYVQSSPVAQVFVHGDSLKSHLVGIVVPDPEVLPDFAAKIGIKGSYDELCKNQKINKAILEDMVNMGKQAGLKSFEQVKVLHLHPEMFTIENGLLTPTLKAKRAELSKYFRSQIDSLYTDA
uniref:Arachidonate--CoA ligase n=1 Tax=Callorhinchus milii TaxID=7868 RepID=A0A4W3ITJ3_CALMI